MEDPDKGLGKKGSKVVVKNWRNEKKRKQEEKKKQQQQQ